MAQLPPHYRKIEGSNPRHWYRHKLTKKRAWYPDTLKDNGVLPEWFDPGVSEHVDLQVGLVLERFRTFRTIDFL